MRPRVVPIRDGVTFLQLVPSSELPLPLFGSRLRAGFPSPADDYLEGKIDLNKYLVEHTAATFLVRIDGDSMTGAGIFGAIVSLLFVGLGFFSFFQLGLLGTGLSVCILGLISGPSLALGLYVFQLRERIAALEKRCQEVK